MQTILIVVHLMIVLALVGVVLMQRSEGGGLGIGGGGSGFMTARGAANVLTRATAMLAVAFFATSLALSIHARYGERQTDILDRIPATTQPGAPGSEGGILDQLGGDDAAPAETAPADPAQPQIPSE